MSYGGLALPTAMLPLYIALLMVATMFYGAFGAASICLARQVIIYVVFEFSYHKHSWLFQQYSGIVNIHEFLVYLFSGYPLFASKTLRENSKSEIRS